MVSTGTGVIASRSLNRRIARRESDVNTLKPIIKTTTSVVSVNQIMKAPATSQEAHHKVKMHKMDSRRASLLIFRGAEDHADG
jgi:hypothetical protein